MGFVIFLGYLIGATVLFGILQWMKNKYSVDRSHMIIISMVYLFLLAGIFPIPSFIDNLFIIFIVEFIIEMIYVTYFLEKDYFDKEEKNLSYSMMMVGCGFLLNEIIINRVSSVFLTPEQLKVFFWFLILLFFYQVVGKKGKIVSTQTKRRIRKEQIYVSYAKLKHQFGEEISELHCVDSLKLYAIMIFGNYQRPSFLRRMDSLSFRFDQRPRKLGIMQVISKKDLDDLSSIMIVSKKLDKIYEKKKASKKDLDIYIFESYDKENSEDLFDIYSHLKRFCDL